MCKIESSNKQHIICIETTKLFIIPKRISERFVANADSRKVK